MNELVFLVEGESEKLFLESFVPRLLPVGIELRVIRFEGKQDLEKRLAGKIRGYLNTRARFMILRDQDSHANCRRLKKDLLSLCDETDRDHHCMVRILCRELETFYLADLEAVDRCLGTKGLARQQNGRKYRSPDDIGTPSRELISLTKGEYKKLDGSRLLGSALTIDNPRSRSFHHFVDGLRRLLAELQAL